MHDRATTAFRSALACGLMLFATPATGADPHSHANPEHVRVRHLDLDLAVDFARQVVRGEVVLTVERTPADATQPLVLDTRGLRVDSVQASADGKQFTDVPFQLGEEDRVLGRPLTVRIPREVRAVRVRYETGPRATALQWLTPAQTAGKRHPYLFTQSQAIEARSWIPLQDSPGVRVTYTARVRTPPELLAVMSAGNDPAQQRTGDYRFEMTQPIPPYLLALAVGDLEFRRLGPRTGVYAEPTVVGRAAVEFGDLEGMLKACEGLYGPYRWGRYDVLVMPPSFPFGGMENPRLTFASPTILSGDKSLVSLLAHELAHSWSGNLVSNATWRDFWLNEGFTVHLERRILEAVYGPARAEAEAVLGRRSLERELAGLPKPDQVLHIDLSGRNPDEGVTDVPYEKGALFLRHLEAVYGRDRLDRFLKGYFDHFAFRSITTAEFVAYLEQHLLQGDPAKAARANVEEWLHSPGLPADAPNPTAAALKRVEGSAAAYSAGRLKASELPGKDWGTHERLHFLSLLPADLGSKRMADLDAALTMTETGNSEVACQWLLLAVRHGYEPAYGRLERFLTEQGRRKFLKPLYEELVKTPAGRERARAIYRKARPTYHPVSVGTVDAIVGWSEGP
jgi:leukotriene-A4 hydrolase